MLKLKKPDSLSIWEIATRLHDIDPETSSVDSLPLVAKDTLRSLITTQEHNFNIFDVDGNELLPTLIPFIKVVKEHPTAQRLVRMAKDRHYDKVFLDSVYIGKDEYESLMLLHNQPLPAFWFDDDEIGYHNEKRVERRGELPENKIAAAPAAAKSERHSKAAQIKHEPQKAVKEQFIAFYQAGIFKSKAQAIRKFLPSITKDELNLFSADRVEKTLTAALTKHLVQKSSAKDKK